MNKIYFLNFSYSKFYEVKMCKNAQFQGFENIGLEPELKITRK